MAGNGTIGLARPLTSEKEAFCRLMAFESTTDLNQSEVYKQTHDVKNLSHKTICEVASRLMADGKVKARIRELRRPVVERFQAHHEAWLYELMACAFVDPGDFFAEDGSPIPIPQLPEACRKMLAGFEIEERFAGSGETRELVGHVKKYKLLSKHDLLKTFGEALGWFPGQGEKGKGFRTEIKDEKGRSIIVEYVDSPSSKPP